MKMKLLSGMVFMLMVLVGFASCSDNPSPLANPSNVITIDSGNGPEDMVKVLQTNRAAFEENLNGKIVDVSGKINAPSKSDNGFHTGDYAIMMDSGVLLHPDTDPTGNVYGSWDVLAYVSDDAILGTGAGDMITLRCKYDSLLMGKTVILDDCKMIGR